MISHETIPHVVPGMPAHMNDEGLRQFHRAASEWLVPVIVRIVGGAQPGVSVDFRDGEGENLIKGLSRIADSLENLALQYSKPCLMPEPDTQMTISEILDLAKNDGLDVYGGAVIAGIASTGHFEVQHDYGNANVSYWPTHEDARAEVARLWTAGEVSWIDDFIVRKVSEDIAAADAA